MNLNKGLIGLFLLKQGKSGQIGQNVGKVQFLRLSPGKTIALFSLGHAAFLLENKAEIEIITGPVDKLAMFFTKVSYFSRRKTKNPTGG